MYFSATEEDTVPKIKEPYNHSGIKYLDRKAIHMDSRAQGMLRVHKQDGMGMNVLTSGHIAISHI